MDIRNFKANAVLGNGRAVLIRSIRPDDKMRLLDTFHRLSKNSIYLRFLFPKKELTHEELVYFTEVDFNHHIALIAVICEEDHEYIVGIGRYIELDRPSTIRTAEFALAVDDKYQNLGMGKLLLRCLIDIARFTGVQRFEADVLAENTHLQQLIKRCGFEVKHSIECGIDHMSFRI